jgi:hypothetical protein
MKKIISITIIVITFYFLITSLNKLYFNIELIYYFSIFKFSSITKNQLNSIAILEAFILIASIFMYRSALNDEEFESRERYENRKKWQFEYAPSTKIVIEKEQKFEGDKDILNDSYKLYLVDKHKVTKNEVFNKFVYKEKMYDSIDEILYLLDKKENNNIKKVAPENYEEYLRIKNDCIEKITRNGNIVKSLGEYPNIEWSILNTQGFRIKKLKSLQELVNFTNSSK